MTQPPHIVCPRCGATSHHPRDIEQRYCGRCHDFHDDAAAMAPCAVFRPDHNGECLNCDEPITEHTEAAIEAGEKAGGGDAG